MEDKVKDKQDSTSTKKSKKSKNDLRCSSCEFIFREVITEDTKCPKCGSSTDLIPWCGGLIIG